jgi:hypothetical protein
MPYRKDAWLRLAQLRPRQLLRAYSLAEREACSSSRFVALAASGAMLNLQDGDSAAGRRPCSGGDGASGHSLMGRHSGSAVADERRGRIVRNAPT